MSARTKNRDIQQVYVERRRNSITGTRYRAVTWDDPDQLYAMVLCAFDINPRIVAKLTGMTLGQVHVRKYKCRILSTDYRNMTGRGIAGHVSRDIIGALTEKYTSAIRDQLPSNPLPTKKESRRNGNGTALTLAHGGRSLRAG